MGEEEPARRVLSAAEKREMRRARILQGSKSRLKLLEGHIATLKTPSDESSVTSLETQLDEGVEELLAHNLDVKTSQPIKEKQTEIEIPKRVDPAQRRRDAAVRRRTKEKIVQEILGHKTKEVAAHQTSQETVALQSKEALPAAVAEPTFSRRLTALKLCSLEEKLVLLLIVAAAVYAAVSMDLSSITATLVADDYLFVEYQNLVAKGVPMDSIWQQLEREQVLPEIREKLELLLMQQLKMETVGTSATTSGGGWLPDIVDVGFYFSSLVSHPPIVFCVFFVRLLVSAGAKFVQKALDLPDVKNSQEGDLGFLVNLALSSRPVLKECLVVGRKALDDVFVFIFTLVVLVAIRTIWFS
ncbi:hypothetical protein KXD40_008621 [Peronospora effusa]|nr:hypothetical protein KXD40_008621 [Peronospora effusa]CAI5701040.1 unnamed protein product [Peronospora effusa]